MMSQDDDEDYNLYSRSQQVVLVVLPYITAPLSAIGSALIVYVIVSGKHATRMQTYQRLMLGMSLMDLASSLGMVVLGHWAVPADTPFVVGAAGTQATCTASYFLLSCLFGSMTYSAVLAVYFLVHIRFQWPRRRITWCVEAVGHFFALIPTIANPWMVTSDHAIHPMYVLPGFCWALNDPLGCSVTEQQQQQDFGGDDDECHVAEGGRISESGILLVFAIILVCMVLLWSHVARTDQFTQQYVVNPEITTTTTDDMNNPGAQANNITTTTMPNTNNMERHHEIKKEALLYIGAFFLVFFPLIPFLFVSEKPASTSRNRRFLFPFAFLTKLLTPLQGLFNAIIMLRRRFLALVQEGGDSPMGLATFVAYLNSTEHPINNEEEEDDEQAATATEHAVADAVNLQELCQINHTVANGETATMRAT